MTAISQPRPWRGLPDELKINILEYALVSEHPRNLCLTTELVALLLTSKHMGKLAEDIWFKNTFQILLAPKETKVKHFPSDFGQHIRRLEVELSLTDTLSWDDLNRASELATGYTTPWRVLLAAAHRIESPLFAWQTKLPNLSELDVKLHLQSARPFLNYITPSIPDIHWCHLEGFLAGAVCCLRADRVTVEVRNVRCGEYVGGRYLRPEGPGGLLELSCRKRERSCAERLATGIKALIEDKKEQA